MIYCSECGSINDPKNKVCVNCGIDIWIPPEGMPDEAVILPEAAEEKTSVLVVKIHRPDTGFRLLLSVSLVLSGVAILFPWTGTDSATLYELYVAGGAISVSMPGHTPELLSPLLIGYPVAVSATAVGAAIGRRASPATSLANVIWALLLVLWLLPPILSGLHISGFAGGFLALLAAAFGVIAGAT